MSIEEVDFIISVKHDAKSFNDYEAIENPSSAFLRSQIIEIRVHLEVFKEISAYIHKAERYIDPKRYDPRRDYVKIRCDSDRMRKIVEKSIDYVREREGLVEYVKPVERLGPKGLDELFGMFENLMPEEKKKKDDEPSDWFMDELRKI